MKKQPNAYPLRLEETLSKKIRVLAEINDRSFKGQIENILKNFIKDYEDAHGEILVPNSTDLDE